MRRIPYEDVVLIGAAVGLDVRLRDYPGPDAVVDAGQVKVLRRLRSIVPAGVDMPLEVGLPGLGEQRAWDTVLRGLTPAERGGLTELPVDVETRLIDGQGQLRRISLKCRDGGHEAVLIVVADTHQNRRAVGELAPLLATGFPVSARAALAAIRAGRHPGGSALVFI